MIKKMALVVGGGLLICLAGCSGAGPDLEEGLWEITTEIHMPGLPVEIPPLVHHQCLSREELIPDPGPDGQEVCTSSLGRIMGNTVNWSGECRSPGGKTISHGRITYGGSRFEGTVNMEMSGAVAMAGTSRIHGQRVGECQ